MDIYETENELVVKADLPDVNEKDIDIRIENNTLTITGERKFEQQVSKDNYLRVERAYGTFSRSFSLPNTVNTEAIQADYHNGLLTVHLPKREESKPKQIKVGGFDKREVSSKLLRRAGGRFVPAPSSSG